MQYNKMIRLPLLLLVMSGILSACEGSPAGGNGTVPGGVPQAAQSGGGDPGQTVRFTIAYATGDAATKGAIAAVIKAYTDAHPDVEIQDISVMSSSGYLDWLKIKDALGEFPDLVEMRDTEAFAGAGKIAELPSDLAGLFDNPPQVWGKVWNAPLFASAPQGIIYSKKAYAAAGVTDLPRTYDEFLAIQEKLKAGGITPLAAGGKDIFHMGFWVNKFLIDEVYARDPDWNAKRNAGEVSFQDGNVVQAVADYKYLFTRYVNEDWLSTGDNQTASMLVSGEAAQLFSGTWMFPQIEEADPDFEFGFYAVPDREGKVNVVGLPSPAGWSLSAEAARDSGKTEAIKDFLRFFYDPEQYAVFLSRVNGIPATAEPVTYEISEVMNTALELVADPAVTKSRMLGTWWGDNMTPQQYRNWFYRLLQELVRKDGDVRAYMVQADAEYDRQLKEDGL
ncbi:ABC transporter substrate-binding protein [Paenibacillus sp. PK3_47]|uniref:ABC transporter substrate-binding protein n=1 Tax=Paenibacillus sp. PK3_47 TaxID=2072642 RepID=UPI00201E641A|nr:ABC transporter substrate-binding protein [Paenibacillus sp. PK3_47]UQZ37251.1 ABC transporter substrate-binding protein [Paenibacillus sp. PK3_47]